MSNQLFRTGSSTVVCGGFHYNQFLPMKSNKLLKITKIQEVHDEFKYLDEVRKIKDYRKYYCIPDETSYLLEPSNKFYKYIQNLARDDNLKIFTGPLQCYYIDFAGEYELIDTMNQIILKRDFTFWKSAKTILKFTKDIMNAINYLHQNKLCHLDLKPENIIIDSNKKFKIIDFGFCSMEPFDDFLKNVRGTERYFPKYYQEDDENLKWFPKIYPNDMIQINGRIPMKKNYMLVYKLDSFSLGRILFMIKKIYEDYKVYGCFNFDKKNIKKLNRIINCLLEEDVYHRLTIQQCLDRYFNTDYLNLKKLTFI